MHRGAGKLADSEAVPYRMLHLYQPVCNPLRHQDANPAVSLQSPCQGGMPSTTKRARGRLYNFTLGYKGLDKIKNRIWT